MLKAEGQATDGGRSCARRRDVQAGEFPRRGLLLLLYFFSVFSSILVGVIQVLPSFISTVPVTIAGFMPVHT